MSIGLFIDGYFFREQCDHHPDYVELLNMAEHTCQGRVVDAHLFSSFETDTNLPMINVITKEQSNRPGFTIHNSFTTSQIQYWPASIGGGGPIIHPKTNKPLSYQKERCTDVNLVFHLMRSYHEYHWNKVVIATGDVDFVEPLEWLVDQGVELYLVGGMDDISFQLTPLAKWVIDLNDPTVRKRLIHRKG